MCKSGVSGRTQKIFAHECKSEDEDSFDLNSFVSLPQILIAANIALEIAEGNGAETFDVLAELRDYVLQARLQLLDSSKRLFVSNVFLHIIPSTQKLRLFRRYEVLD